MFDDIWKYCKSEWSVIKGAPLGAFLFFFLACSLSLSVIDWHYSERIESMKERINAYETRLSFISSDEEVQKMRVASENLNKALEEAHKKIDLINKDNNTNSTYSWVRPICVSFKDRLTRETMEQLIIHNEVGKELGLFDQSVCKK